MAINSRRLEPFFSNSGSWQGLSQGVDRGGGGVVFDNDSQVLLNELLFFVTTARGVCVYSRVCFFDTLSNCVDKGSLPLGGLRRPWAME